MFSYIACPPAMHAPLPCTPPAMHTLCHTCPPIMHTPCYVHPLSCTPPAMHAPSPAMHAPLPHMPPLDKILDTRLWKYYLAETSLWAVKIDIMETDTGAHTVTATENRKSFCCHRSLNEPLNYACAFIFTRTENILISIQKVIIKYWLTETFKLNLWILVA